MTYGKIFESLFTGSMVGSGPTVFAVWTYCIANSKPPGVVELNPVLIAASIGDCTPQDVETAITKLEQPDANTTTQEEDGRRLIREGAFLYRMPTWPKYNAIRREQDRREQTRRATRKWRENKLGDDGRSPVTTSEHGEQCEPTEMEIETQAGGSLPTVAPIASQSSAHVSKAAGEKPFVYPEDFEAFWNVYPKRAGKGAALKAWKKLGAADRKKATEQAMAYAKAIIPGRGFVLNPATWLNRRSFDDVQEDHAACDRSTLTPQQLCDLPSNEPSGMS